MNSVRLYLGFICLSLAAFGQMDGAKFASDLRSTYGPPLPRQTFVGRTGIELVVDYAANGNVCRIQLPPMGPEREPAGVMSTKAVDDFLTGLLPVALRGKELRRFHAMFSLASVSTIEYENLVISETFHGAERIGVTVTFANERCHDHVAERN